MDTVSKTNPLPPSGLTNTSVPLGITSSVSETPQPVNVPVLPTSVYESVHGIYLGKFEFSDGDAIGKLLYEFDYQFPLTTPYKRIVDNSTHQVSPFTPWDLVLPSLSKQVKMEYTLQMIPVKIADSRARVDVVHKFNTVEFADRYGSKLLANYNARFHLDDPDEQLIIPIPTYWVSNNVSTDMSLLKYKEGESTFDINLPSAFLPTTYTKLYVASKYQHNAMQMESFSIHVVLYPRATMMIGMAGKRSHTVVRPAVANRNDFLTPYFMNFR
jgi:hypothetical protein